MTSLADHPSSAFAKLLYLGNSGTGKTGSLVSLVKAGYKLRILDLDNGFRILQSYVLKECPDKIANVDVETQRDKFKIVGTTMIIDGQPKAFAGAVKLLDKWSDGSSPKEWGEDTILVIDSLTRLGDAAFEWAKGMNPTAKDPRQWYGAAQVGIEHVLSMLTADEFHSNVIVCTHVRIDTYEDGTVQVAPSALGQALGPKIPAYFNDMVLAVLKGFGDSAKRVIQTVPNGALALKTSAPFSVEKELPIETGMATLFASLKSGIRQPPSPNLITLQPKVS